MGKLYLISLKFDTVIIYIEDIDKYLKTMFDPFFLFLIESDTLKYLNDKIIRSNLKTQLNSSNLKYSVTLQKKYFVWKNEYNESINEMLNPILGKDLTRIIKEYLVFYEIYYDIVG